VRCSPFPWGWTCRIATSQAPRPLAGSICFAPISTKALTISGRAAALANRTGSVSSINGMLLLPRPAVTRMRIRSTLPRKHACSISSHYFSLSGSSSSVVTNDSSKIARIQAKRLYAARSLVHHNTVIKCPAVRRTPWSRKKRAIEMLPLKAVTSMIVLSRSAPFLNKYRRISS
jgi:hypothetical protein